MRESPKKVALVTNIPTPYRIPLFNELAKQLADAGAELVVIFAARGYARRKWKVDQDEYGFRSVFLCDDPESLARNTKGRFWYPEIRKSLVKEKAELAIVAGFNAATAKLCVQRLLGGIPYLIWSGATIRDETAGSWIKALQRKILVWRASGFVAYGTEAKEYLMSLGIDPDTISVAINTVDTAYFREAAHRRNERDPEDNSPKRILSVGELIPRKRFDLLIKAVAQMAKHRKDFKLDIVGSGVQEIELRNLVDRLGIADLIEFHGFQQRAIVREYLIDASCFAFPTGLDIWGLVLPEAMAAGVACLSSIRAGATRDLIDDGVTGFAVDFEDIESVSDRLNWVLDHPIEADQIGWAGSRYVDEMASIEASASGFLSAMRNIRVTET